MSTPSSSGASVHDSTNNRPKHSRIKKGTACNNCRTLKIKCDGAKPQCTACTKFRRVQPCEYNEARPSLEALEAEIRILRTRIEQLQNSPQGQSPVSGSPSIQDQDAVYLHDPLNGPSPEPNGTEVGRILPPAPNNHVEYSTEQKQLFIDIFLTNAQNVGYFLGAQWLKYPLTMSGSPSISALMTTACLWGLVCSKTAQIPHPAAGPLLRKALESSATILTSTPNVSIYQILEAIQVHILLSKYLFRTGRWDAAAMHASCASTLVVSHHLHQKVGVDKEVHQIQAVWQALVTEASQAVMLSTVHESQVPAIFDLSRACISICWPGDSIVEWAKAQPPGTDTVQSFLRGATRGGLSPTALFVKSIIVLYHVSSMENVWTTGHQHPLFSSFRLVAQTVDTLTFQTADSDLLTRSIVHCSDIRLHKAFMLSEDQWSLHKCLSSANATVELALQMTAAESAEVGDPTWCHDLFGCIWLEAVKMLYVRIQYLRGALRSPWPGLDTMAVSTEERNHLGRLNQLVGVISTFSDTSTIMGLTLTRAQELVSLL